MRTNGTGALVLVVGLVVAAPVSPAAAQRFTVGLQAGGAVGNYTATDAGLEIVPSLSFGAVVEVGLTKSLAAYVGATRSSFGCEEALCTNRDVSITSQGLIVGGRFAYSLAWTRAGVAFQGARITSNVAEETADPGIGWDLAAGVDVPVGRGFRVRPGLSYRRHDATTDFGDGHVALLALEVGIARSF